ncbi:hypothetical protein PHYBLDRAFT_150644 [Phycomyces blakesleeanus NRRL 1555(-)]|uniref:Uncharacterized protein n=1 Tax=Phycomyces blakesleeanus (strain ATCC 8743b / DSM 1359 / FGSC 10004 / NBRC 33097 / NRRL 1555) TaxID=763407 RepID=A0A162TN12_PHYB8|nr:hypothetical protein PHYBLDRAFT_150644 [Phycomyces blakesleeanus NRRL 1555(-)]OAD68473.1 hypothetical protein PHYBLDRAFT_150644 [Phycomyces blakesleeanus NRRL 1555(-)]|eukprot:XP_018286513.1 hypothetical protein PHYBLDRAFT_150644 [Phycomyces blakesleeanus NRRL 1555(-)]
MSHLPEVLFFRKRSIDMILLQLDQSESFEEKFEIEEQVQALLPAELASSFATSHTAPSLPEELCLRFSPSHVAFWDTQAQNIVGKLSGVPVSTPPAPNFPVHIPVTSSLPMSTPPAPVNPAAPAAPAAMTIPKSITAFTTAFRSSQPPAAYTEWALFGHKHGLRRRLFNL